MLSSPRVFPPVAFPLSSMKTRCSEPVFRVAWAGYRSRASDRKRTPFGVHSSAAASSSVSNPDPRGKECSLSQMALRVGDPCPVAQKREGAIFEWSGLGLRVFFAPQCPSCYSLPVAVVGRDLPRVSPPSRGLAICPGLGPLTALSSPERLQTRLAFPSSSLKGSV